jgi:hypothetical protein
VPGQRIGIAADLEAQLRQPLGGALQVLGLGDGTGRREQGEG